MNNQRFDTGAFTLVEMLVTLAILGVVMVSLASVYTIMARGMLTTTARASALEELSLAASQMAIDLRNMARNSQIADSQPYHIVGISGDPGFENTTLTPHRKLSTKPNNHSDRLHFHANFTDDQIAIGRMASERVYYAYWINGEGSNKSYSGFSNRYGLLKRRSIHRRTDLRSDNALIPYIESYNASDSVPTPLLDLNESFTNQRGIEILGINIDYLSVRYYDRKNDRWQDCWDTTDPARCAHNGDDNGEFPSVVQFAIRAYDRRANQNSTNNSNLMQPVWYQTAVALRNKN